jgi:hypothetical protein
MINQTASFYIGSTLALRLRSLIFSPEVYKQSNALRIRTHPASNPRNQRKQDNEALQTVRGMYRPVESSTALAVLVAHRYSHELHQ